MRWNLDPVLLTVFVGALALYLWRAQTADPGRARTAVSLAGWLCTLAAFVTPLCSVSVALFSARVAQHMFLATVCAPLLVLGRPWRLFVPKQTRLLGTPPRDGHLSPVPLWAAATFGAAMWWWHAPNAYDATFASIPVYWAMHLTIFGSAIWLWQSLLDNRHENFIARIAALALTALQMGVLGAILSFSERPLYLVHLSTTWPWGVSPLEDQQIGGAIMWAPSGLLFVGGFAWAFVALLRVAEMRAAGSPLNSPRHANG